MIGLLNGVSEFTQPRDDVVTFLPEFTHSNNRHEPVRRRQSCSEDLGFEAARAAP